MNETIEHLDFDLTELVADFGTFESGMSMSETSSGCGGCSGCGPSA